MKTYATRRTGTLAFIDVSPSRNNEDMLFMSSPLMCELTKEQAMELIETITIMAEQKWGN